MSLVACSEVAPSRVMHLVDVENLMSGPNFTVGEAQRVRQAYLAAAPAGLREQVVIATSHHAASAAWSAWPEAARRLLRSGRDGADLALLRVVAAEALELRFDRVVIGSGDGIFAPAAARLQAGGCSVTVVTRRESLSKQLRLAVLDIRFVGLPRRVAATRRLAA
jgi:NYN domain